MKVSVVIPCYNSEESISEVVTLTKSEIEKLGYDYEFILVNDYSKDRTYEVISSICKNDKKVKGICLSRNFGQHNAIIAGLNYITGDYVLAMDDDLQTHPSQIYKLFEKLNEGYDIVYGVYKDKKHSPFRNFGSWFARFTASLMVSIPKDIRFSSFWIAKSYVTKEMIKYKGPYPDMLSLILRTTKNIGNVEVKHYERVYGHSNYTLKALLKLWSSAVNLSIVPLRFATILGLIFSAIGGLSAIYIIIRKLLIPSIPVGWTSVMVGVLFFSGIILLFLGVIGEYLGRLFMSINGYPQYIIKESNNIDDENGQ